MSIKYIKERLTCNALVILLFTCIGGLLLTGCHEEVIEKMIDMPGDTVTVNARLNYTHITSFTITEASSTQQVKASIRKDSVYVYWPAYWQRPGKISPQIVLAEKATVLPASTAEVDFKTGTTYTVTAEDGTRREYTLVVVVNQTMPYFSTSLYTIQVGQANFSVQGDYFIPDTAATKLYFVSKNNQDFELETTSLTATRLGVKIPEDLDTGTYAIKLISGWRKVSELNDKKMTVTYPALTLNNPNTTTVAREGIYTLSGTGLRLINAFRALHTNGTYYSLEIVSYTLSGITIKVPADFPLGQYTAYQMDTPAASGGIYTRAMTSTRRLTVTE